MERLKAFEKMLADIRSQSRYEALQLEKYREYGLLGWELAALKATERVPGL